MSARRPFATRLRRALSLPAGEKALLAEAAWSLGAAWLATRLRPFRSIAARLDHPTGRGAYPDLTMAQECAGAVRRMARVMPLRLVCFQQALALHALMARRHIPATLHFGLSRETPDALAAHVWITCGDAIVLGGEERGRFTELARFPGGSTGPAADHLST